jgi:hypothetical protein
MTNEHTMLLERDRRASMLSCKRYYETSSASEDASLQSFSTSIPDACEEP